MANNVLNAKHLANRVLQRVDNFRVVISGVADNVMLLLKNFPLPSSSNEVIGVKHGNSTIKVPGAVTYDSGDMEVYDSVDQDTELELYNWRQQVYNDQTGAMDPNCKKTATVTEYTADGSVGRQWKMFGVWPSSYKPGAMQADGNDLKTISMTLEYDWAYRVPNKV